MKKDKTVYFNTRTQYGVETIQSISLSECNNDMRAFRKRVRQELADCREAYRGLYIYKSQRPTKTF